MSGPHRQQTQSSAVKRLGLADTGAAEWHLQLQWLLVWLDPLESTQPDEHIHTLCIHVLTIRFEWHQ